MPGWPNPLLWREIDYDFVEGTIVCRNDPAVPRSCDFRKRGSELGLLSGIRTKLNVISLEGRAGQLHATAGKDSRLSFLKMPGYVGADVGLS